MLPKEKTSKQSKDNEDAPADSLVYETIDAIKFMDLPNSLDLPKRLSTNLYAIGIINLLCFVAMLIALKRKDSV